VLDTIQPQIIINCAAYTAVDKAETETELADILNHQAVAILAQWTQTHSAQLLHVSTDYVFDGNSSAALTEEATTGPINVYGQTKLAGEQACLRENPNAIVIRTSWVYSRFGNNFVKTMSRLMQERDSLNVVNDQSYLCG
jgi:dTDP-4-dehydrorhamnose reductase